VKTLVKSTGLPLLGLCREDHLAGLIDRRTKAPVREARLRCSPQQRHVGRSAAFAVVWGATNPCPLNAFIKPSSGYGH